MFRSRVTQAVPRAAFGNPTCRLHTHSLCFSSASFPTQQGAPDPGHDSCYLDNSIIEATIHSFLVFSCAYDDDRFDVMGLILFILAVRLIYLYALKNIRHLNR